VVEQWIDEGSIADLRDEAVAATARATSSRSTGRRRSGEVAPEVLDDIERQAQAGRVARYTERLSAAADALDRGRFEDARRMVQPVLRDLPDVAFAHELAGLALYRVGQWRKAATELEIARGLDRSLHHHAVLADCYRALRRYRDVDDLWSELRQGSPAPSLMAEGRIVAAGALADQGDLAGALKIMKPALAVPKRVRDEHLRQWYVIADLFDRSGDVISARRYFGLVAEHDPDLGEVGERLKSLGRPSRAPRVR
jgi:tetratricopeptide (TPR) repeat protein